MSHKTDSFSRIVSQHIEFAGFGPASAQGSKITVHAFGALRSYMIRPDLSVSSLTDDSGTLLRFPNMLSPATLAVLQIIHDAYGKRGVPAPGSETAVILSSDEIPYRVEVNYLWLLDATSNEQRVVATLYDLDTPLWATESTINYNAKRDSMAGDRIKFLVKSYIDNHPLPSDAIKALAQEIIATVDTF